MVGVEMGWAEAEQRHGRLEITAAEEAALDALLAELQVHGVSRVEVADASTSATDRDGVFPSGFYSTTNLPTEVRLAGSWHEVDNPEMDCGLVVEADGRVRTVPVHRVRAGDEVVVGHLGVRVQ